MPQQPIKYSAMQLRALSCLLLLLGGALALSPDSRSVEHVELGSSKGPGYLPVVLWHGARRRRCRRLLPPPAAAACTCCHLLPLPACVRFAMASSLRTQQRRCG